MHHYFEAITNTSGDSLVGYFARVIDPASLNTITLSSDDNGTPIVTVSGVENMASTDAYGNISFYVVPGTYHLDIYAPNATSFIMRIANVAMDSSKGEPGERGPPGPPGSGGTNLDELTDDRAKLAPFWDAAALNDPSAMTIRCSGDSTTMQGNQYPDYLAIEASKAGFTVEKSGASGKHTGDWLNTYLAADIAAARRNLLWGWGANDAYSVYGRTNAQFEADARAGMTQYRAALPASDYAVTMLSPNMVNINAPDADPARTPERILELDAIIRQVAKDFDCAYLSRFLLFPANGLTSGALDSAGVHPTPGYATIIGNAVTDFVLPQPPAAGTAFTTDDHNGTDAPSTWPTGVVGSRVADGVPHNGFIYSLRPTSSAGAFPYQINAAYGRSIASARMAIADPNGAAGSPTVWGPWVTLGMQDFDITVGMDGLAVSPTALIDKYPAGDTTSRVTAVPDWPYDGFVFTRREAGVGLQGYQTIMSYNTDVPMLMRRCRTIAGVRGWSSWTPIENSSTLARTAVAPASGFTQPTSPEPQMVAYAQTNRGFMSNGYLIKSTPAVLTNGTAIATVPAGGRPLNPAYISLFAYQDADTFQALQGRIDTAGVITVRGASTITVSRIYVGSSWDLQS